MRCIRHCDAYRLGDVYYGYFEKHFNISRVCAAWPHSLACGIASRRVGRDEFCRRLRRPDAAPAFAVHLRLGDVHDWPTYRHLTHRYARPVRFYQTLPLPSANVSIYGDAEYRLRFGSERSRAYERAVVRTLQRRGALVHHPPHPPANASARADADFAALTFAANVSLSFGKFAALIRKCRKEYNYSVLNE